MKPAYTFSEIIEFIHNAKESQEIKIIADVFYDERLRYSSFHGLLIDHALNIAYYLLQVAEQEKLSP